MKIIITIGLIAFFCGLCLGSKYNEIMTENKCEIAFDRFNNDTDVWIDYNGEIGCYDKIKCNKMYDRNKGHHQMISISYED